jgi:hypothetical protein
LLGGGQVLDRRNHRREGKKLTAVARALANARAPSEPEADQAASLAIIGLSAEQIEAYQASRRERQAETEVVEVLAANWDAVAVFQRCGWQLVSGGMGRPLYVGIEAQEIAVVARALRVKVDAELLDDVRHVAAIVREVWNKRS